MKTKPIIALSIALVALGLSCFSLGYNRGKRAAPKPAAEKTWRVPGYIEIVDGKIIVASNVHVRCTSGAFSSGALGSNVVIQPYQLNITNPHSWDGFSPYESIVFSSNGVMYEVQAGVQRAVGVTVRLCAKCNGRRFLKHDDFRLPSGEVVARDVACSQCKGEGVEGP